MRYRQYGRNTAKVVGPDTVAGVRKATQLVTDYYRQLLIEPPVGDTGRVVALRQAQARTERFAEWAASSDDHLGRYVDRLNAMPRRYLWWWSVANPELEELWEA